MNLEVEFVAPGAEIVDIAACMVLEVLELEDVARELLALVKMSSNGSCGMERAILRLG